MADPKNPFNFGTGSIDKDQWLKDIDNEQEGFVSQYANAANKHRTTLLRQAFQDLRNRIVSGDMLSRTADGQYQFGSALISGDEHMQEAYQRALGFMGNLARRQINTPAPEPEKKSVGNIEERWIKSLNPSGTYNKSAYWKNQTDQDRRTNLRNFLNGELTKVKNHEYNDFGDFNDEKTLTDRLSSVLTALDSEKANDWTLQQLGFTNNWLQQPEEEKEETTQKSELEQVKEDMAKAEEAQQVQQGRQYLAFNSNRGTSQYSITPSSYDFNAALQQYMKSYRPDTSQPIFSINPSSNNSVIANDYVLKQQNDLDNYFKNFAISWKSNYESGDKNKKIMQDYLSRLFSTYNRGTNTDGTPISDYAFDWKKYFTQIGQNQFLINGSLNKDTGRYAYYVPGQGINESNILDTQNQYIAQQLGYTIPSQKEGGKIEFLQSGGGFDYDAWEKANTPQIQHSTTSKPPVKNVSSNENEEMDVGDWITVLGTTAADIGSMLSANAVGTGTVASAGLGVLSTLGNSINDFRHGNVGSGLANLGIGLSTDLVGLIPGFGTGAKGYKIGRTLTRFARPLMAAFTANNFKEAGQVLSKGVKNGFGSLTAQDWTVLGAALTSMISRGKSAHSRQRDVEFLGRATKHSSPTDSKGNITKYIINEEGLNKARRELLDQKKFGFNTSSRKTTSAIWNSIPEGGERPAPYFVKPFQWPKLNFGKDRKYKQLEMMEEFAKRPSTPPPASSESGTVTLGPPVTSMSEPAHLKNGAKLKALRRGGIIKAQLGLNGIYKTNGTEDVDVVTSASNGVQGTPQWGNVQFGFQGLQTPEVAKVPEVTPPVSDQPFIPDWYMQRFGNSQTIKNLPELTNHTTDLKERQSGTNLNYAYFMNDAYANSGQANKQTDIQNYFNQSPDLKANNLQELITFYNNDIDTLYSPFNNGGFDYTKDDATNHNNLFKKVYGSRSDKTEGGQRWDIGWDAATETLKTAGSATHARRPVNYEKTFDEELKTDPEKAKQRVAQIQYGNVSGQVYVDEKGKLQILTDAQKKLLETPKPDDKGGKPDGKDKSNVVDEEVGLDTPFLTKVKNPFDPTLLLNSAKLATSLIGNADIYKNLLAEMPEAPLRDGIDRKLAIVGDQRSIDAARNKLADLRQIQRQQQGSDQQTNFASALEAERVGRDIMDNGFKIDAVRQFDTAQKSWNIDNEDAMYNTQVADANRKSIADRARMMAQIRAAYRNGNWNAIKSFVDDTSFWALKKYQREQDLTDKAKEVQLGTLEQKVDDALSADSKYKSILDKYNAGQTISDEERAYIRTKKAEVLKQIRGSYASDYYNMYHDPMFGGGFKTMIAKEGGSLEKEKLKARGKDNDRYVSMIKDLRKTSYRRRRR